MPGGNGISIDVQPFLQIILRRSDAIHMHAKTRSEKTATLSTEVMQIPDAIFHFYFDDQMYGQHFTANDAEVEHKLDGVPYPRDKCCATEWNIRLLS